MGDCRINCIPEKVNQQKYKGEPIRAMAREICQNSLDAVRDSNKPVRVEFERLFINPATNFPGIEKRAVKEALIPGYGKKGMDGLKILKRLLITRYIIRPVSAYLIYSNK